MTEITVPLTLHPISTCLIPPHPPAFSFTVTSSRKPSLTLWMKLGHLPYVLPAPCLPSLQCSSHSICLKCAFLESFQKIPRGEPTQCVHFSHTWESSLVKQWSFGTIPLSPTLTLSILNVLLHFSKTCHSLVLNNLPAFPSTLSPSSDLCS